MNYQCRYMYCFQKVLNKTEDVKQLFFNSQESDVEILATTDFFSPRASIHPVLPCDSNFTKTLGHCMVLKLVTNRLVSFV